MLEVENVKSASYLPNDGRFSSNRFKVGYHIRFNVGFHDPNLTSHIRWLQDGP